MIKKFFSLNSNFNIFNMLSIIVLLFGLYNKMFNLVAFGIYLDILPRLYVSFIDYKNTKKIKFLFAVDIICFAMLTFVFTSDFISLLTKF